ncbi:hypothetical protein HOP50_16g78120 [Chloropicon primus]|uniref:Uncharacterized protein n=1 Tax=Chloropicon primus TaxID=1764295 RepID=A0A5B8N051_9CHLO|nr:hypothetical protein A3770_16p77830 [Chloropicon primus]UPR04470.1 hypothetical protein HOP50_16g78120 [Chloropicon primus]|eukprot:QDZ25265.1 hypothetical protein A3770_16p77830 [Chloropicon primus]
MSNKIVIATVVALVALAAGAGATSTPPPVMPTQYMVQRNKTECGDNCGGYAATFIFDEVAKRKLEIIHPDDTITVPQYTLTCGDLGLVFEWTGDGSTDCQTTAESKQFPFHGEWDWLKLNSSGTHEVPPGDCPPQNPQGHSDGSQCLSWEGSWEGEVTALAQLFIKEGEKLPIQHQMTCSILPFMLFYTYADWKVGPPPSHWLQPPKACPTTPSTAATKEALLNAWVKTH